jgi:preprotein translocase subunit SecD
MLKERIFSIFAVVAVVALGYFYLIQPEISARKDSVITQNEKGGLFKLGLDLVGGSQLTYDADISKLAKEDVDGSMKALKETLNRRLNPFGTSEVSVVVEDESIFSNNENKTKRVIIQIPGESDPEEAKKKIGKMPLMEFKILRKTESSSE